MKNKTALLLCTLLASSIMPSYLLATETITVNAPWQIDEAPEGNAAVLSCTLNRHDCSPIQTKNKTLKLSGTAPFKGTEQFIFDAQSANDQANVICTLSTKTENTGTSSQISGETGGCDWHLALPEQDTGFFSGMLSQVKSFFGSEEHTVVEPAKSKTQVASSPKAKGLQIAQTTAAPKQHSLDPNTLIANRTKEQFEGQHAANELNRLKHKGNGVKLPPRGKQGNDGKLGGKPSNDALPKIPGMPSDSPVGSSGFTKGLLPTTGKGTKLPGGFSKKDIEDMKNKQRGLGSLTPQGAGGLPPGAGNGAGYDPTTDIEKSLNHGQFNGLPAGSTDVGAAGGGLNNIKSTAKVVGAALGGTAIGAGLSIGSSVAGVGSLVYKSLNKGNHGCFMLAGAKKKECEKSSTKAASGHNPLVDGKASKWCTKIYPNSSQVNERHECINKAKQKEEFCKRPENANKQKCKKDKEEADLRKFCAKYENRNDPKCKKEGQMCSPDDPKCNDTGGTVVDTSANKSQEQAAKQFLQKRGCGADGKTVDGESCTPDDISVQDVQKVLCKDGEIGGKCDKNGFVGNAPVDDYNKPQADNVVNENGTRGKR